MKKFFLMIISLTLLCATIASCNEKNNVADKAVSSIHSISDTNLSNTEKENSDNSDIIITNSNTTQNGNNDDIQSENKEDENFDDDISKVNVSFVGSEAEYYNIVKVASLNNIDHWDGAGGKHPNVDTYLGTDFPQFTNGKSYYKIISSYSEMTELINGCELDEDFFEENYLVVIKIYKNAQWYGERVAGYYDFQTINEKGSLKVDYYESRTNELFSDSVLPISYIDYIAIPRNEIEYKEGVNALQITFAKEKQLVYDDMYQYADAAEEHGYNVWVFREEDSQLANELKNKYGIGNTITSQTSLLLQLSNVEGDFIFTGIEIADGNLYIYVKNYKSNYNSYFDTKDIDFFQFFLPHNSVDVTELSYDFNTYITIEVIE